MYSQHRDHGAAIVSTEEFVASNVGTSEHRGATTTSSATTAATTDSTAAFLAAFDDWIPPSNGVSMEQQRATDVRVQPTILFNQYPLTETNEIDATIELRGDVSATIMAETTTTRGSTERPDEGNNGGDIVEKKITTARNGGSKRPSSKRSLSIKRSTVPIVSTATIDPPASSIDGRRGSSTFRRSDDENSLYFECLNEDEKQRSFHDFVKLLGTYDRLTRDERGRVVARLRESLSAAETALCLGSVLKRPSRDVLRVLCYGARINVDRARESAGQRMKYLGFGGTSATNATDTAMIKNVDSWYEFASDSKCSHRVPIEDVTRDPSTRTSTDGPACRDCVHALLRLCRTGLNVELARGSRFGDGNAGGTTAATATVDESSRTVASRRSQRGETIVSRTPASRKRRVDTIAGNAVEIRPAAKRANVTVAVDGSSFVQQHRQRQQPKQQPQQQLQQQQQQPQQHPQLQQQQPQLQQKRQRSTTRGQSPAPSMPQLTDPRLAINKRTLPVAQKHIDRHATVEGTKYSSDSANDDDSLDDSEEYSDEDDGDVEDDFPRTKN